MNHNIETIQKYIRQFVEAKQQLKNLDVLRSERTIGEFGEWFVEQIINGKRAATTSQSDWDIEAGGLLYQIKTHAKGPNNKARWTELKHTISGFDFLVIVVFSHDLYLKEYYQIPYNIVLARMIRSGKSSLVKWDHYKDYQIFLDKLPLQNELVKHFIKSEE
jgi:hypothetical protein